MKITKEYLLTVCDKIFDDVEQLGIGKNTFCEMAGFGKFNALKIAKNPRLSTIIRLIEQRDKLRELKKRNLL